MASSLITSRDSVAGIVHMSVCLWTDFQCNHVITMHDAVTKLYRCVAEIEMKADIKDGCGLNHEHLCNNVIM